MPISSGASGRTRTTSNRMNKSNLKRSSNWPDVVQSNKSSLATSSSSSSSGGKSPEDEKQQGTSRASRAGNAAHGQPKARRKHLADRGQQQQEPPRQPMTSRPGPEKTATADQAAGRQGPANKPVKIMSSLGGQRVVVGGAQPTTAGLQPDSDHATSAPSSGRPAGKVAPGDLLNGTAKQAGLFTSIILSNSVDTNPASDADISYKKPRMLPGASKCGWSAATSALGLGDANKPATTNYSLGQQQLSAKSSLQNSQASLLNPSMSFLGNQGAGSAGLAAGSASSLANLHNHHHHHHHHQPNNAASLNISRRVNLKYVKILIVLLMSLDLLITIFVHHFSSHDELAIAFTSHKLRFSLLNLLLSSLWFVVLSGAIIFDVYPILLLGCLVDFTSFVLLLVCSVIHFTHRIDYNTVNLTSLLLLLFSIIVLHVYLLVIAALTTYLLLAVKRRRKIQA